MPDAWPQLSGRLQRDYLAFRAAPMKLWTTLSLPDGVIVRAGPKVAFQKALVLRDRD